MDVEKICTSLKDRGGFSGNYEELVDHVRQFLDEAAYNLCDGFAVNFRYFSIHPNIGGSFNSVHEVHDSAKNPIGFRFRTRMLLRNLVRHINVEIAAIADVNAYIDQFINSEDGSVNSVFVPGEMFCVYGNKIKVAGDNPGCGVYFVPVENPSKAVKAARIGENKPTRVTGIAPAAGFLQNRIEIRTQYNGSNSTVLKAPRVITSNFIIEEA